ncbi:hypothetical protein CGH02_17065 [Vibrio parahaemolyticus]|uniref:P27 family phage terminase small subunit n=2 Tax=Vibrionaceae TaxID=641 RepID=UPI000985FB91|nr:MULTISPECIES: hypothetical protein [Vibrio]EGS6497209.1 hypothetical protein [Vibrio parahaemolyticus]ELF4876464.1 hypothetical protein [Vibrio parahaemolyticus]MDF4588523.1 hypothetical protein [Vibrio parahaemolyticus]OOI08402.1 hypothetical protein BIW15_10990 [Vibrio sp. SALL6]TOE16193.1 hypothetical protein CGJ50_02010 [Vibrio parahaemolyticus]
MAKITKSPQTRLNILYGMLEELYAQLSEEGVVYSTTSTQGETVPKQNPAWKVFLEINQEIRMIEVEQGKTALGKERRKKLAAEAKKLEAEANQLDAPKDEKVTQFLLS